MSSNQLSCVTSGAGTVYPSEAHEFTTGIQWASCYSIFSFICKFFQIFVCPFVLFLLAILLSVFPRYTDSESQVPDLWTSPLFLHFFNSSLLWDVFIINSVEQLQTLPKTQSEIDISPFLKTQKPSSKKFKKKGGPQIGYLCSEYPFGIFNLFFLRSATINKIIFIKIIYGKFLSSYVQVNCMLMITRQFLV